MPGRLPKDDAPLIKRWRVIPLEEVKRRIMERLREEGKLRE